jgi:hypothetical protein
MGFKQYLGLISGAAFGLIAMIFSVFGLVSLAMEMLFPFLFPAAFVFRTLEANFTGMMAVAILLNMLFFGAIGHFLQKAFKNRSEWTVVYAFLGIVVLLLVTMGVEAVTRGLSA